MRWEVMKSALVEKMTQRAGLSVSSSLVAEIDESKDDSATKKAKTTKSDVQSSPIQRRINNQQLDHTIVMRMSEKNKKAPSLTCVLCCATCNRLLSKNELYTKMHYRKGYIVQTMCNECSITEGEDKKFIHLCTEPRFLYDGRTK